MMNRRDDLRNRNPTSHELPKLNKAIQNRICVHIKNGETLLLLFVANQLNDIDTIDQLEDRYDIFVSILTTSHNTLEGSCEI